MKTVLKKFVFLIFSVLSLTQYAYSQELGKFEDFKPGDKITYSADSSSKRNAL